MMKNVRSKNVRKPRRLDLRAAALAPLVALASVVPAPAIAADPAIEACLSAFGETPFGTDPEYRTLPVSVKVFGIGGDTVDDRVTGAPELVYIKPGVNVMGGTVIRLQNPQGWYCMRSAVNVMGGFTVRLACDAHFVIVGEGATVLGKSSGDEGKGTTVMGSTTIEREC